MSYVYGQGNLIQTVRETAHNTILRVASTIDAFRPKILFKRNLTELPIVQKGVLEATGLENILENIQNRIQAVKQKVATPAVAPPQPEQAATAAKKKSAEAHGLYIAGTGKKKTYIY